MDMIARRDVFDFGETWMIEATGEHDVTDETVSPEHDDCKTHAHLKGNPRFLGDNTDGATALHKFREFEEECDPVRALSGEVLAQRKARAEMGLIAVRKEPSTFRAFPEARLIHDASRSLTQDVAAGNVPRPPLPYGIREELPVIRPQSAASS